MTGVATRSGARLAGRISEVFTPRNWMLLVTPLLGWHADGPRGACWGLLAVVFTGVIPPLCIALGGRRRHWGGALARRQDRLVAAPWILGPVLAGAALLHLLGAPRPVTAAVAAMLAVLLVLAAITTVWKVSAHCAVTAGASALVVLTYGPRTLASTLALAAITTAVGWSRIRLGRHTPAQVVVGVVVGALAAGLVYERLR